MVLVRSLLSEEWPRQESLEKRGPHLELKIDPYLQTEKLDQERQAQPREHLKL